MANTVNVNISLNKKVFESLEEERKLVPRSTIINTFVKEGLKLYIPETPADTQRIFIDFDLDMSSDFETLREHFSEECGEELSKTDFFKKVFITGMQSKEIARCERMKWEHEQEESKMDTMMRKAYK